MRTIEIYDTTLRDGSQGEGINFSLEDKLAIARRLAQAGVDFIEGGYPLSNPKDAQFFARVRDLDLCRSRVVAFGMTRRRGMTAAGDPGMKALLDAGTPVVTIVGKTSAFHVAEVLPTIVTTGVSAASRARMPGSSAAVMPRRRVMPKATSFVRPSASDRARSKNWASLGFESG